MRVIPTGCTCHPKASHSMAESSQGVAPPITRRVILGEGVMTKCGTSHPQMNHPKGLHLPSQGESSQWESSQGVAPPIPMGSAQSVAPPTPRRCHHKGWHLPSRRVSSQGVAPPIPRRVIPGRDITMSGTSHPKGESSPGRTSSQGGGHRPSQGESSKA